MGCVSLAAGFSRGGSSASINPAVQAEDWDCCVVFPLRFGQQGHAVCHTREVRIAELGCYFTP